jgi:hypothetical protein
MDKENRNILIVLAAMIFIGIALYLWSKKAKAQDPPPQGVPPGPPGPYEPGNDGPGSWQRTNTNYPAPTPTPWTGPRFTALIIVHDPSGNAMPGVKGGFYFNGVLQSVGVSNSYGEILFSMPDDYLSSLSFSIIHNGLEQGITIINPWSSGCPGGVAVWPLTGD